MNIVEQLYNFKEFKEFNNLPDVNIIPCKLQSSILQSHYFISSWVKHSELNLEKFDLKIKHLIDKDKERDNNWIPVTHIICFDTLTKHICLVDIGLFRAVLKKYKYDSYNVLKKTFGIYIDFFIPRSIWWKSFIALECDLNLNSRNKNYPND